MSSRKAQEYNVLSLNKVQPVIGLVNQRNNNIYIKQPISNQNEGSIFIVLQYSNWPIAIYSRQKYDQYLFKQNILPS